MDNNFKKNINSILSSSKDFYYSYVKGFHVKKNNDLFLIDYKNRELNWCFDKRTKLESLKQCDVNNAVYYLFGEERNGMQKFFNEIISIKISNEGFDLAKLDGCTASKSFYSESLEEKKTMAEVGETFDDDWINRNFDLNGDVVKQCIEWNEIRSNKGFKIIINEWDHRCYWYNFGGSHHMAYLCYYLKKNKLSYFVDAIVERREINLSAFDLLDEGISLFVTAKSEAFSQTIFERSPYQMYSNHEKLMGVYTSSRELRFGREWQVIIVNSNADYAHVTKHFMENLCEEGRVIPMELFLKRF